MTRRVGALFGMAMLLALVLILVWNVHRHHELMHEPDEPGIVRLDGGASSAVVNFAPRFC